MKDQAILSKAKDHVERIFGDFEEVFPFHNVRYIEEVVEVAEDLAEECDLTLDEIEVIKLSCWFYYAGFPSQPNDFLSKSIEIASDFLTNEGYADDLRSQVIHILSETPSDTSSLANKIVHDALVAYKGRKQFFRKVELLRLEKESTFKEEYSDYEWEQSMYESLVKCVFYTEAGQRAFRKRRIQNITKQRDNVNKALKLTTRKRTGKEFGRGIDTLYRTNYNNQISLSSIADGKANMMISINTIILSVIITFSGAGFSMNPSLTVDHLRFVVPIFILLIGSLFSVVFAVISARPKVTQKKLDMELVKRNKTSLLFFGNFLQVPLDDYVAHLSELKTDQQHLYDSMSVDMYYLGMVLNTKYKWLTWSYNTFMISLILCVMAFVGVFIYTNR